MSITNKPLENDPAESKKLLDTQKSIDVEEVRRVCAEMPLPRDTTCGFGFLKGAFLQKFANQTAYVIIYGMVGCVFAMASAYFNATISTLEKRFKIPSRNTGMIMIGNDLSQVMCSAFLGYYAGKKHRPRWMGFGNIVTGTVALAFSAIAILLSGFIISKYKPRARYLAAWNILVDIVTMSGMIAYAFIGCSGNDISLINNSYDSGVLNTTMSCNSVCHCDYVRYMPVCGEDMRTYISPCHAGCKREHMDSNGIKSYYDCSCIPTASNETFNTNPLFERLTSDDINNSNLNITNLSLGTGGQAMSGACPVKCSQQFITFLAVMCVIKFFAATGRASNLLITMRSVSPEDKSALMGFGMMFISLVCFVPAPIFYGWIFDKNCLVWGKTCTNKGNCWLYDAAGLRLTLNLVAAFFVGISTFCNAGVWYHVKHLKVFDDEEEKPKELQGASKNEQTVTHTE